MIVDEDNDPIRRDQWHTMDINALAKQRELVTNKISLLWTLNPTTNETYLRFLNELNTALKELDFLMQNRHSVNQPQKQ